MMWQRLLNRLLVALLLVLLLLVSATTALLASQSGNLWLLERARPYLPGQLEVQGWQGSLATGLKVNQLTWRQDELTVSLSQLDLLLDVGAIFSGRLHLYHLSANSLAIALPTASPTANDRQPPSLPASLALPFGARIDRLSLQHLRLTGASSLNIDAIHADDLTAWRRLRIGRLALTLADTRIDASLDGKLAAPYPLAGRIDFDGQPNGLGIKGQLHLNGGLEHLRLKGQGNLQRDQQTLHLDLAANASLDQIALDQLTLSNADQQLTLTGQLGFSNGINWQLDANGKHLNPGLLLPDWPGDLNLALHSQGHWNNPGDWAASANPLHLDGTLKNRSVQLDGKAQQQGQQLALDLTGQWGKDRLSARGSAGKTLALTGQVAITDLGQWLADAQGRLNLDWQVAGTPAVPLLSGRLNGTALGWQGWQLQTLRSHFSRLSLGNATMRLDLGGESLTHNGSPVADRISLNASGTRAHHKLALSATRGPGQTQLTLDGSLNADHWQGQLQQWQLASGDTRWHLQQPAPLSLSATSQQLKAACLIPDQGQGKLCLDGTHSNSQLAANLAVSHLPLALANPWLGETLRLGGELNADANLHQDNQQMRGQWQASIDGGSFTLTGTQTQQLFHLSEANLTGTLDKERISNNLNLTMTDVGEVRTHIEQGLSAQAPLRGELHLSIPRLDDIAPLLPHVSQLHGSLSGDLQLGGNLQQHGASGRLTLADGALTLPELGITIDAIRLDLDGTSDGLRLQGQAGFDQQLLHLDGHWHPLRSLYALELAIKGDRLLVANRRDAKVFISPNLSLKGTTDSLHLQGTLAVPEANLAPRQLPENAISVSKDQVLVGTQAPPPSPLPLFVDLGIHLGKQVRFQGFGLNASLGGDLRVTQQPAQPVQLYGELVIREGRYKAYGQNLAIDNGRLLFQGPADDPGLDIRALRKIPSESQTVGVQLSGTLQHPKAQIFSDPALEESQAMSYLLTGHGLNQGSQGDRAKIARALALYGLQQGEGVTNKISDTLGLDEITVGSEWGDADDAALMLGKQLSDRLYLTYAVGLFDAVSTVMLRYTLTRSLHLEAQSSSRSQAIDLIWEKELK